MAYCLYLVAKHPAVETRALAEIRAVLGPDRAGAPLTYAAVGRLEYCQAVVLEALRLYPPAPLTVPGVAPLRAIFQQRPGIEALESHLFGHMSAVGRCGP